jgi:hypothetical protein
MYFCELKIAGLLLQKIIWLTDPSQSMFIEPMLGWYVITSFHIFLHSDIICLVNVHRTYAWLLCDLGCSLPVFTFVFGLTESL